MLHDSSKMRCDQLLLCYLRVPFQLASTPGFHVTHIPEGNLVLCVRLSVLWQYVCLHQKCRQYIPGTRYRTKQQQYVHCSCNTSYLYMVLPW